MKINELNATILQNLLTDGRKSFSEIAVENGTSKEVVANRYKQMRRQGIITGATVQVSEAYRDCNFGAFIFIKSTLQKQESVIKSITQIPNIFLAFPVTTDLSILAFASIKNVQELENLKQSIKALPFVLDVDTYVRLDVRNTPENLSIFNKAHKKKGSPSNSQSLENHKIDEIDKAIIEKLSVDSRAPFSKIGKELNVSIDTIARRYEKLRVNGDVKSIIQINPIKLGYSAFATFDLSFTHEETSKNLETLSQLPDINVIFKISGRFDFNVIFMIRNIDTFTDVQEQILKMPGLLKYRMSISKMFPVWPNQKEPISTF